MKISKNTVDYLCGLCKLYIDNDEIQGVIGELNEFVDFIDKIKKVDIENEEEIVNPYYMENNLREDIVCSEMDKECVLKNTKNKSGEFLVVPKVIK